MVCLHSKLLKPFAAHRGGGEPQVMKCRGHWGDGHAQCRPRQAERSRTTLQVGTPSMLWMRHLKPMRRTTAPGAHNSYLLARPSTSTWFSMWSIIRLGWRRGEREHFSEVEGLVASESSAGSLEERHGCSVDGGGGDAANLRPGEILDPQPPQLPQKFATVWCRTRPAAVTVKMPNRPMSALHRFFFSLA